MENFEQKYSTRNIIIVAAIAELASSFTLWLVSSPIKYSLFIIETCSIITIFVILSDYDFGFNLKSIFTKRVSPVILLDLILICFSIVLILSNVFNTGNSTFRLILAFVCTSGLSGYALLNVSGITKYFSRLEIVVLSFLTSFILSGFCTIIFLSADEFSRGIIMSSFFIILGIASFMKDRNSQDVPTTKINSFSKNIDVLAILLCIAFYAVFFYYVYPNFTLQSANDIVRHYQWDLVLSRTPDLYGSFSYFLFHAYGSALNILSGSPDTSSFLTIQLVWSFILPLSVYIFAKRFLADVDRRIPAISTIFYTISSNLSFIYFVYLKISGTKDDEFKLLANAVAEKTYDGTVYFLQPFAWVVPITVTLAIFIIAFMMLRVWSIPRSKFIPIYTVLILAMYLTHVPDAPIFAAIIGIYSMISKSKSLRFDDALLSSLIAFILAALFVVYTSVFWPSLVKAPGIVFTDMLPVIASIFLICISIFWRRKILHRIHFSAKFASSKKFYQFLSGVFVTIYLLGLFTWFFDSNFKTSLVTDQGYVPWFIYPLSMGIAGFLALMAIRHMSHILPNSSVAILLGSLPILVLFGKTISFVNLNFFDTGYFEKRLLIDIFPFACLLAPIPIIKLVDITGVKRKFITTIGIPILISLIILVGFSSMVLQTDYWARYTQFTTMTPELTQAIDYLKNVFQHEPRAFGIATSLDVNNVLVHSAPPYLFSQPDVVWFSKNPEIPLFSLNAHDLTHAYIYVPSQSMDMIKGKESWMNDHLLPTLPVVFSNSEVTIYNATHVSYPRSNSDTTLIIPSDPKIPNNSFFYAYDIISKHDRNYTVMFDRDQNALKSKNVVLSYDPLESNSTYDLYDKFSSLIDWKIASGYWKSSTDGLHGGDPLAHPNQIIVSPISSKNFTVDTSFRILDADPSVATYVSIVSAWKDAKNYESAQIAFYNHHVYVSLLTVREGKQSFDSPWPGNSTSLSGEFGNLFNVTLSKQGNSEDFFLNGTNYLHREYPSSSGFLGLGTSRISDIVFDHINIHNLGKLNLRDPSDYISYVKSGGNLVLLNTNGYHSISNALFNLNGTSYEADKIAMAPGDYLSANATILPLLSDKDVTPLALYSSSDNKSSILVASKTIGLGNITYVDIFPIISSFKENRTSATAFQEILDRIGGVIDLPSINRSPQKSSPNGNFNEMNGNGSVTIKSASLVFPDYQFMNMTIQSNDKEISVVNVTKLGILGYHNATLQGNSISVTNGKGFYGNLAIGNSTEIFFDKDAKLDVISDNNTAYHFDNVSNIVIQNNNPIHTYAWQPEIKVSGQTVFKQMWGAQCLAKTYLSGKDFGITGNVSLTLFMSDTSTYFSCVESTKSSDNYLKSFIG